MAVVLSNPPSADNVSAIQELPNGGRGAIVQHPRARSRVMRRQLRRGLTEAGLDHRVAMTLMWVTSLPTPEKPASAKSEPSPGKPVGKVKRRKRDPESE